MIHRQHSSDLPDFLIGLLGCDEIVEGKQYASEIPQPSPPYPHSGPEPSIQSCCDPCCSEIRSSVEVREGLGAFEANKLAQVPRNIEVEEGYDDGLPRRDEGGELSRDSAYVGRAMLVPSDIQSVDSKDVRRN